MAGSTKQFSAKIREWAVGVEKGLDAVCRQTAQEMAFRTISHTPVDTGFAKGSWQPSINTIKDGKGSPDKASGRVSAEAALVAAQVKAGDVFYLTNNAHYIVNLEYGHSKQAPNGMVRPVIAARLHDQLRMTRMP